MPTRWILTRGLSASLLGLGGLLLASCGSTSHAASTKSTPAHAIASAKPVTVALPPTLASAVGVFSTTPVRFSIQVNEHGPGIVHRPTVYGAWDPINGDGEVAIIAANGGVESAYGASRVVDHRSWSLISGHWYHVGFGQQEIGQVLAVLEAIKRTGAVRSGASALIAGTTCVGYSGQLGQAQLRPIMGHGASELSQAFTGLRRLRYTVYVGAGHVQELKVASSISQGKVLLRTQWLVQFPGWGMALSIRPPLAASVLPGSPPPGGILPL